ncbi:hypothetical protein [Diaphorobacter nitroreducens]|uniref:hypothetical protein n=1 Tax=Diaphorobacter nitroreducens TaxID=164759 RepID=UPI0028B19283|nr:hypothetical protein [Diaphorobacter nitroreducens]
MPDLTGTRQSRRDGFIDNGSGTAMQPTPRDNQRDYLHCAYKQVFTQIKSAVSNQLPAGAGGVDQPQSVLSLFQSAGLPDCSRRTINLD